MEFNKLTLLTLNDTGIPGGVSFCNCFEKDIVVVINDVSICVKECECCCILS